MKKFLSALMACIMALTVIQVAGMTVFADAADKSAKVETKAEDVSWGYEVISEADKTCRINGYNGDSFAVDMQAEIVVPSVIDGYTVVEFVLEYHFKSITFPASIKSIPYASVCSSYSVYFECSEEEWNEIDFAGAGCPSCDNFYINNKLIKDWTVKEGTEIVNGVPGGLETVTLPASVKSVNCTFDADKVYYEGTVAGWINIDFGWYSVCVGKEIYIGGELVKDIVIPEGVTRINGSFDGCSTLETVSIPSTVTSIAYREFEGCSSLKSVEMAEGVKSIDDGAFSGCGNLKSVKIPASVTDIGEYVFNSNVVIYGIAGSYAETYAKENGLKFVNESGNVAAPEFVEKVTDSKTNITVSSNKKGVIPEGAVLTVETKSSAANKIVYDITLTKDGKAVQPNGKVTVKIPVSAELGKKANVYRQETNGKYTNMKASYKDGFMVFETEHFSTYVVTTENLDKAVTNTSVKSPNTGASSIMLAAVAASGAVLTLLKKKRDAE